MKTGWIRRLAQNREIFYFNSGDSFEAETCARTLHQLIKDTIREQRKQGVVFLCIGTDRSTGDSLGPLIGYKLKEQCIRGASIVGTLDRPVHAMNLEHAMMMVDLKYPNHVVVAVDASVGSQDHVGYITLGRGALRPGLGVKKDLREVGDIFITGIVGGYGNHDPLMLQSVRLAVVMQMADCICDSIFLVEQFWENAASF